MQRVVDFEKRLLSIAIDLARYCPPAKSAYSVGAVILTAAGELISGYSRETDPVSHAEEVAIMRARERGCELRGASIFTSMEPCSKRASRPKSCTELIIESEFNTVIFALEEPDVFVDCDGQALLAQAGIEVVVFAELGYLVEEVNNHLLDE